MWNVKKVIKGYIHLVLLKRDCDCFRSDLDNTYVCAFQCNLHIHGEYSLNSGISPMLPLSDPSAVGLIIAHGNKPKSA